MQKNIYCIGGACIDKKLKSIDNLQLATSNPVSSFISFGGVARNVAENLAYWTKHIYLQSVVGNDSAGRQLLAHMKKLNVNIDECIVIKNAMTAAYYAVIKPSGELHIAFADMNIYDQIDPKQFTQSWQNQSDKSIIFIDTNLPTSILETAIKQIKPQQLLCIDPVSTNKSKKIPYHLENVFLIKPNQLEITALTNITVQSVKDCIKAGNILLDRGVKNVVVSLGKHGYVIINDKNNKHYSAHETNNIQDENGAGDAFFAGILYGLQQNFSLTRACQLGNTAAIHTIQSNETVISHDVKKLLTLKTRRSIYARIH